MEKHHRRALDKSLVTLVDDFDPGDILHHLIADEVMSHDDAENISAERTRKDKVNKFIRILQKSGSKAYSSFIIALGNYGNYSYLVEEIKKNEDMVKLEEHQLALDVEVEEEDFEDSLMDYMKTVGLYKYYPGKLTLQDVKEIRVFDQSSHQINIEKLPFLFISKLTSLDSRVVLRENLKLDGSVRDFIFALMHCSDAHLQQHIMEKMAACQLAVTVFLPGAHDKECSTLMLWALRRVVKKWKEDENCLAPERRMIDESVFTVTFLRLGNILLSKSVVLNNVLGRAQGNETFRYFLPFEEDKQEVYFSTGTVEAQWYLPMHGRDQDIMKEVTLILNLRGDALSHTKQARVASQVSNATFVFVNKENVQKHLQQLDAIRDSNPNVYVLYLVSNQRGTQRNTWAKRQQETTKTLTSSTTGEFRVDRGNIELAEQICIKVEEFRKKTNEKKALSMWPSVASIITDQDIEPYSIAMSLLEKALPMNTKTTINELKKRYFPLQQEWLEWVNTDRTPLTADEQNLAEQIDEKERKKLILRQKQKEQGLSIHMKNLLQSLMTAMEYGDSNVLHYFMNLFQTYIENIISHEIPPLIAHIDQVSIALQRIKKKGGGETVRKKGLHRELIEASEQFNARNISCEQFIRELGHLFEANHETRSRPMVKSHVHKNKPHDAFLKIAAKLLLEGYPLELLDGESTYIQIHWIEEVLHHLQQVLSDPKIFVLSIIGIQSSGKSTLLNSMFGVRFPVRSGRCTRGLFLQLLKVNKEFSKDFGFEYLIIIDTEGLQSPDRTVKNDYTFDNSVATLAMCVGDLTLLNIGQETIGSDMIGILQIAVHALMRMKKVNLVSHCRIIQQRVSDLAAAGNNKANMAKIKTALDKATLAAAQEEQVDNITDFSDVFPLVGEGDLQFFPCLWLGIMSPPNHRYSDKIHELKAMTFASNRKGTKIRPQFTIERFAKRLRDVWNAVKAEDFVFHFQNSFDALSNQRFRFAHNQLVGTMRTNMVEWELAHNIDKLTETGAEMFYKKLASKIRGELDQITVGINEYVKAHSDEDEVKRRQESIKQDTFDIAKELENGIRSAVQYQLRTKKQLDALPQFLEAAKKDLRQAAREQAQQLRKAKPHTNFANNKLMLNESFQRLWEMKCKQLENEYAEKMISDTNIDTACENSLTNFMRGSSQNKTYVKIIEERKRGTWTSSFYRYSKQIYGYFFHAEQRKMEKEVDILISSEIDKLRRRNKAKPFNKLEVNGMINTIYNKMKQRKVRDTYIVDALLGVTAEIAGVCKANQHEHERVYSLTKAFQAEKGRLQNYFLGYFDDTIKAEAAADRLYSELLLIFQDQIINLLNVQLISKLRQYNHFIDKQHMTGTILDELCRANDEEKYVLFVKANYQFVTDWVDSKVKEAVSTNAEWLRDLSSQKISSFLENVKIALTSTKLQKLKLNEGHVVLNAWLSSFQEQLITTGIHIKVPFTVGEGVDIIDIVTFTEKLESLLSNRCEEDIFQDLKLNFLFEEHSVSSLLSKMKKDVSYDILQHLRGCQEVCPFCGVNCHLQGTNHKHKAIFHQSPGVIGFRNVKTQKLQPSPCTMLVASNNRYRFGKDEDYRYYKNYAQEFPDWDITPIRDDLPIDYWKWVLNQFNDFFAERYSAKPASIPFGWTHVTQEDALENLREYYNI